MPTAIAYRLALLTAVAAFATGCALNRPHVKNLRDHDAGRIQFDVVHQTTVTALNAVPSHCGPALDHRVRDEEFRVYQVVGRIRRVKREPDHDLHIVLEETTDPGQHLIVELDDPDFRGNRLSPYRDQLVASRSMFAALSGQAGLEQLNGAVVRVTGVGFFDPTHFQIGRSRSCIELHPILTIERAP